MRTRCQLAAITLFASVAVVAAPGSVAGAVDQDLVVSATSGAPGDEVTVSSASCVDSEDAPVIRVVQFRLVSGTAPDQQIIGIGIGADEVPTAMVLPDWADPTAPAVIEASCLAFNVETGASAQFDYDPVAFDLLPGAGAPTQTRTYSRTSLLAGQGFSVEGTGCDLGDDTFAETIVFGGGDLTGRTWGESVSGFGGSENDGTDFQADTLLSNGGLEIWLSEVDDGPATIEKLVEVPTDIPAGAYTAITACENDGSILLYEPQLIEVTGDAPFDADDVTFDRETRAATIAGSECTSADGVAVALFAASSDNFFEEDPDFALRARAFPFGGAHASTDDGHRIVRSGELRSASLRKVERDLGDGDYAETVLDPAADGTWSGSQKITFNRGFVEGDAACGDPFADGFVYDPQAAEVTLPPLKVEQTTTTTTPAQPAPPANALPGNATFAG